jgi:hypothetical protein
MEAVIFSETSAAINQCTRRDVPEDLKFSSVSPQRKHPFFSTKTSQLILYVEIIAVYSDKEIIKKPCGQILELRNYETDGTYINH